MNMNADQIIEAILASNEVPDSYSRRSWEWEMVRENIKRLDGRADRGDDWTRLDDLIQSEACRAMKGLVEAALKADAESVARTLELQSDRCWV